ncbi:TRAP-type C4-dicarboxylate transport system permease small subunit [Kushneria sinocarnis]|uniref:TRAP transporter small permease protein n=1 Tax=Kushneria sinocarnis TaxID=595502 RepID=A0A420WX83_9GAMM|nr:TRAP transporter small permease [Kushneria sinocarnis]RKR04359.1 TRAP-type C4-dicarboxylate transport system permease small subunit [Kushneria sinocarnis]
MTDTGHDVEPTGDEGAQVPALGGLAGRLMRGLDRLLALLSALSLLGIVVVVVPQIVSRLMLPITLSWTEELSRYLFIWMVALSAGLILRRRRHITLELFQHRLGRRGRALHQGVVCLVLGGFSLIALSPAWRFAGVGAFQTSPTLGIPMIWIFVSMTMLLALVLFYSVIGLLEAVLAMRGPRRTNREA